MSLLIINTAHDTINAESSLLVSYKKRKNNVRNLVIRNKWTLLRSIGDDKNKFIESL
jgi:exopolysaccharide biosynthesis protein